MVKIISRTNILLFEKAFLMPIVTFCTNMCANPFTHTPIDLSQIYQFVSASFNNSKSEEVPTHIHSIKDGQEVSIGVMAVHVRLSGAQ